MNQQLLSSFGTCARRTHVATVSKKLTFILSGSSQTTTQRKAHLISNTVHSIRLFFSMRILRGVVRVVECPRITSVSNVLCDYNCIHPSAPAACIIYTRHKQQAGIMLLLTPACPRFTQVTWMKQRREELSVLNLGDDINILAIADGYIVC